MTARPALLVLALWLAACAGESTGVSPTAQDSGPSHLRLVHGGALPGAADLLLDGHTIQAQVQPATVSPELALAAGAHDLAVRIGGQVLTSTHVSFQAGVHYTAVVTGPSASATLLVAGDTAAIPQPGQIKIRVVHAAPDAPPVDVYLTAANAPLDGALRLLFPFTFGTGSSDEFPGYVSRDPGDYRVRFTQEGTQQVLVETGAFSMSDGQVATVLLEEGPGGALQATIVRER